VEGGACEGGVVEGGGPRSAHRHIQHHQWLFVTVDATRAFKQVLQGQSFTATALFESFDFEDEFIALVTVDPDDATADTAATNVRLSKNFNSHTEDKSS